MNNNPFSLTFGIEPNNLIKRIKETDKIISEFSNETVSNYVYLITGLRGSGKTVLLSLISEHFSRDNNWVVVDPGPKDNILENVASEIYENGKVKNLFLKPEFSVSFHGLSFSIKGDEPASSINTVLKRMFEHAKKKGKRILITIDEVDNSEQMKHFIEAYQSWLRLKYPVFLLMTGLYDSIYKLQNDKSLTFLYRAPKINLEPLNIGSVALSYKKYLNVDEDKAIQLAQLTKGYAYAYQVLGYLLYDSNLKDVDDAILSEYDQYLSDYVYDKVYSELSNKEQIILRDIEEYHPIKLEDLVNKTGISGDVLGVYRIKLIKKGLIESPKYGYVQLALPRFAHFIKTKHYFD